MKKKRNDQKSKQKCEAQDISRSSCNILRHYSKQIVRENHRQLTKCSKNVCKKFKKITYFFRISGTLGIRI